MAQASEFGVRKLGDKGSMAKGTKETAKDQESAKAKSKTSSKGARPTTKETLAAKGSAHRSTHDTAHVDHGGTGVTVARRWTTVGTDPLDAVIYERRGSAITNPDGSVVFKMEGAEVPATWSQLATDIVISKYFRKAGLNGDKHLGETSVRQVVRRIARTIRRAGEAAEGYFATKADADTFEAELSFLLVNQYGAFN